MTTDAAGRRRGVFLDRDGTINIDYGYVGTLERFELLPRALEGIGLLGRAGFLIFLVSNQSGLERKLFTREQLDEVHAHLQKLLEPHGAKFTEFYISPYKESTPNDQRKPSPKYLLQAAKDYGLDLARSYMIGDRGDTDILCGKNAGCRTILVRTGTGKEWEDHPDIRPDHVADDLYEAAKWIVARGDQ
ncbi:MAG: HAD family hydrolase [Verrucomicrobiae bacterium]|nr:HAD family hydrolase [Verrucomicrobiae bacterium]